MVGGASQASWSYSLHFNWMDQLLVTRHFLRTRCKSMPSLMCGCSGIHPLQQHIRLGIDLFATACLIEEGLACHWSALSARSIGRFLAGTACSMHEVEDTQERART